MTINEFVIKAYTNSYDKGFWKRQRNVGEMLMLVVGELSEALEALRDPKRSLEDFNAEIADAFIRLADMCGGLEIDIEKVIQQKMTINEGRPHLHGKLF